MKKAKGLSGAKPKDISKANKQTSITKFLNGASGGKALVTTKPSGSGLQTSITSFMVKKPAASTTKTPETNTSSITGHNSDDDFKILHTIPKTPKIKRSHIKNLNDIITPIKTKPTQKFIKKTKIELSISDESEEVDCDVIPPTPDVTKKVFKKSPNLVKDEKRRDSESSSDDGIIPPTPFQPKKLRKFGWTKKRTREIDSPNAKIKRNCHSNSPVVKKVDYVSEMASLPVRLTDLYGDIEKSEVDDEKSEIDDESPVLLEKNVFNLTELKEKEISDLENCEMEDDSPVLLEKNVFNLTEVKDKENSDLEVPDTSNIVKNGNTSLLDDLSLDFDNLSPFKLSQETEVFPPGQFRYIVKTVHPVSSTEKVLTLAPDIKKKDTKLRRSVYLRDFWADTDVNENDVVHIFGVEFVSNAAAINSQAGIIVVKPDILISSTAISSTLFCKRKTFLSEIFKGWDSGNKAMLIGCVVHQLFQTTLEEKLTTEEQITREMTKIFQSPKILQDVYSMNIPIKEIENAVAGYAVQILSWVKKYASKKENPLFDSKVTAQLVRVHDIEENFWSPTLGLKGKIDVTAEVKIHTGRSQRKLFPIELKTGKPSFSVEHQGQITLYSMMMSERYEDPQGGLLLYLQDSPKMKFIESKRNNQNGLITIRNDLAMYFSSFSKGQINMPEPATRYDFCKNCPMLLPCTLSERSMEASNSLERANERLELVSNATKHLKDSDLEYFLHWFELIHLESRTNSERNSNHEFWNIDIEKRVLKGICFSDLKISTVKFVNNPFGFFHKFIKSDGNIKFSRGFLKLNDSVVVSCLKTPTEIAVAIGNITELSDNEITLHLDKNLTNRPNWKIETFFVDIYNSISFVATNYRNLARLMTDTEEIKCLRSLIIDRCYPETKLTKQDEVLAILKKTVTGANKVQKRAIYKSLLAEKYFLIRGMPGTGKTSTIVNLVKALVAMNRSVLLTSFTHSAVDNILLKLKATGVDFMRMGKVSKVHNELKKFTVEAKTAGLKEMSQIEKLFNSTPVIATTCLSVNEGIFKRRKFSVCIVDEASQIPQPVCLGPLFLASTFILVGDSKQLPPLAQSKIAKEKGFCESLFQRLESCNQVQELTVQYRMNEEIMRIANELTYENKLVAGNECVANATLKLKFDVSSICDSNEWRKIVSANLEDSILFLNTRHIEAEETNNDRGLISNEIEAEVIVAITKRFIKDGLLDQDSLGIISPYREQVRLITQKLQESSINVEINTVDQYQGRDKEVILFSSVRSSRSEIELGEILHDWKRLNVAITRAKHKLILVGDKETLNSYGPFAKLFEILRSDQIINSPKF